METHKIDQLFKQKLERHSEPVSADAFAKMQAQMKGKKQKKGFPWMIAASVSILMLISIGLGYNYNQSQKPAIAKIDLGRSDLSLSEGQTLEKPQIKEDLATQNVVRKENAVSESSKQSISNKLKVEELSRMASIDKINSVEADFNYDRIPKLTLSPHKYENEVRVEIHYAYAERKKEENLIEKSNNKLKSLASEFSLADLRNAKNDLFASAFQFNKKENN